jgi:hypothetical protein
MMVNNMTVNHKIKMVNNITKNHNKTCGERHQLHMYM